MYYFSIFEVPPPICMASDFTLNRFCNDIVALNRSNATKKKKSSIHPLKPLKKMCLKEQHPTELQSRNPGPRSNKTNGISSMHPGQGVHLWCSCLVPSRYLHGLDGSTICICCFFYLQYPPTCLPCLLHPPGSNYACNFSIFSIPHLFACFTTHTGVRTACNCTYHFSIFEVPPPIYMASDFTLNRFCNPLKALKECV